MNIELSNKVNTVNFDPLSSPQNSKLEFDPNLSATTGTEMGEVQQTLDEANRLLQMIITQLSGAALRRIPASEYLKLISVLDGLVSTQINEQV